MTLLLMSLLLAGQLHVSTYGLKESAARGDTVRVGVIGAVSKDRIAEFTPDGGKPERISLYGGVVWKDPHKSPIDSRLRDAVVPPPGTKVLAVPAIAGAGFELLAANAANLRKRDLLFDAAKRADWLAGPDSVLRADLDDPDLGELARGELGKRGKLEVGDLLLGDEALLHAHYRSLTPAQRRALLDEAAPLARARPDAFVRWFTLATLEPTAETIGALLAVPFDAERLDAVRLALLGVANKGPADLSGFADFLVLFEWRRPSHLSKDEALTKLTALLDVPAKQKVALGFLTHAMDSKQLIDGVDLFLIRTAAQLAREAPSAALLAPLEKWDLARLGHTGRRFAVAALVDVAASVAPLELLRARALAEPVLAGKVELEADAVARYRAVVPPVLAAPAPFALDAVGLGSRHTAPGVEVRFDAKDATATLTLNFGKGDEAKAFPLDGDWPTEWKTNGWTFALKRVAGTRSLKLSAAPP